MNPGLTGLISLAAIFLLIMLGVPVAFTLASVGVLGMALILGFQGALGHVAGAAYAVSAQYAWAVAPLFVIVGSLAGVSGVTTDAFNAARKWLGRLPGGMAMATTVAAAAFAACSGSTVASAALFTPLALPEMLKRGYDKRLSVGCIACTGTFAAMIPPSITFVIYGVITGEPIGQLLIAGIIPGIITMFVYLVGIYVRVLINPRLAPMPDVREPWREKLKSLRGVWGIFLVFLTIIGGIYTGLFAPTAAAAVGAFMTLLIVAAKRKLTLSALRTVSLEIVLVTSTIFLIIIGGTLFGRFWVLAGVINWISDLIVGLSLHPMVVICMFMVMYIILGCFLDPPSIMIITMPLVYPIATNMGYSGIWLGVLMVKITEIAVLTPPVGFNAYMVHSAAGGVVTLEDVFGGIVPFILLEMISLVLLLAFPEISLWLPNMMK